MKTENGSKPAYPTVDKLINMGVDQGLEMKDPGLTKREIFAMAAMQGLLSNGPYIEKLENSFKENTLLNMNEMCAREAVDMADELLKQLENE